MMRYKNLKSVFDRRDEFTLKKVFNRQFMDKILHGINIVMWFIVVHSVVNPNHHIIQR